jgi:hypothetical protein
MLNLRLALHWALPPNLATGWLIPLEHLKKMSFDLVVHLDEQDSSHQILHVFQHLLVYHPLRLLVVDNCWVDLERVLFLGRQQLNCSPFLQQVLTSIYGISICDSWSCWFLVVFWTLFWNKI